MIAVALLKLAGCATPPPASPLAAPEADADGKAFEAKPGMGRLYILHGDIRGSSRGDATNAPGATSSLGLAFALALNAARRSEPEPLTETGRYYLNDRLLGIMGQGHYMALDLPPGEYALRFEYDLWTVSKPRSRSISSNGWPSPTSRFFGPGRTLGAALAAPCSARARPW